MNAFPGTRREIWRLIRPSCCGWKVLKRQSLLCSSFPCFQSLSSATANTCWTEAALSETDHCDSREKTSPLK